MKGKVVMLGGCGAMASSTAYDLAKTSDFDEIVIADNNEEDAKKVIALTGDKRFSFTYIDAANKDDLRKALKGARYVVNGLPFHYEQNFLEVVAEAGNICAVDLNGFDFEKIFDMSPELAKNNSAVFFANGGVATTCGMGMLACEEFDEVESVDVFWGMWRPITHTTFGLTETITYEHDPKVDERCVWTHDKGLIKNLPPFAEPRVFTFAGDIGTQETYILTHTEPATFWRAPIAKEKRVKRVIARGIWHHSWTRYQRVLLETGIFEAEPIEINGTMVKPFEVVMKTVERENAEQFVKPEVFVEEMGFIPQVCLSTEVTGYRKGRGHRVLYHATSPFPFFDGKAVTAMMEYGCYVGTPMSVTLQMMAKGEITQKGVFSIEESGIDVRRYFEEMGNRGFKLIRHHDKNGISDERVKIPSSGKDYKKITYDE